MALAGRGGAEHLRVLDARDHGDGIEAIELSQGGPVDCAAVPAVVRLGLLLALLASPCLASCGGSDGGGGAAREPGCSKDAGERPLTELRHRVESTPGTPGSFAETMRALCRRLSRLGYTRFAVRRRGHELALGVPRSLRDEVAILARPGRLAFFDWEPNVLGPRGPDLPFGSAIEAVEAATAVAPAAEPTDLSPAVPLTAEESDRRNDAFGELHYLFGRDRRLLAGPAAAPGSLATARARAPAGSRVLRVPRGVAVVAAERSGRGWFVIEDDAELSRSDIAGPRAEADPRTNAAGVAFDLTEQGRTVFADLTRRVAQRAAATGEEASFAIVLDGQILARPTVDPAASPNGVDGGEGVRISVVGSRRLARRLALLLRVEALPANLVPLFGER